MQDIDENKVFIDQIYELALRYGNDVREVPNFPALRRIREWSIEQGLPFSERYIQQFQRQAVILAMRSENTKLTIRSVTRAVRDSLERGEI